MATEAKYQPRSEATAKPFSAYAYPFVVLFALSLFSRIADQLGLDGLIARIAHIWRDFTHVLWTDLFALVRLPVRVSAAELDVLTFSVLMIGALIPPIANLLSSHAPAASKLPTIPRPARGILFAASFAALMAVFMAPYLGQSADAWIENARASWGERAGVLLLAFAAAMALGLYILARVAMGGPYLQWVFGNGFFLTWLVTFLLAMSFISPGIADPEIHRSAVEQRQATGSWGYENDPAWWTAAVIAALFANFTIWLAAFNPIALPRMIGGGVVLLLAELAVRWIGPYLEGAVTRAGG